MFYFPCLSPAIPIYTKRLPSDEQQSCLLKEEVVIGYGRQEEAVVCERCQGGVVEELKEPDDGYVCENECGDESDGEHGKVVYGELVVYFEEVIRAGYEHERCGDDEGEVCRGFTRESEEKTARDGRAGAREARPEGEYLEDTDERCFFDGELIDVGDARLFRYFFCKEHEKTADDECHDDCHGRE